jgi:hypothetical protein
MKCTIGFGGVLIAHKHKIPHLEMPVMDGQKEISRIQANRTNIVNIGVPSVTLLTEDSTPEIQKLDESAEVSFEMAVENLVKTGQKFYTQLRPTWALPAILWEKAP